MSEAPDSLQFPLPSPLHPWLTKAERRSLDRPGRIALRKRRQLAAYPETEGRSPLAVRIEDAAVAILGAAARLLIREVVDVVLELLDDEGTA